jgi:nitrous oxidase accessory protein NosD
MKTCSNQLGTPKAMAAAAMAALVLNFPVSAPAAPHNLSPLPAVIALPTGATGAEIQQALDSLPASGGEVVLPPGDFLLRAPVVLQRDGQTLRGSGGNTVLRLADHVNCPVIILGEPVNRPQHVVKNLCVRDLFIEGNRRHQTRELWKAAGEGSEIRNNGITLQAVEDSRVENVTSARCRSGGLVTTLGVRRLTVRNFESFDNEFDGLACYQTEDSLFIGLNLHHNPGAGISLDLAFNHNVISNATLTANDLGIFMRSSHDNEFHGVAIHASRDHGVFMANAEHLVAGIARPAPATECAYNAFTNLTATNCGGAAFRVNNTSCTNNILIGSSFTGNRKGDLSLAGPDLLTVR